MSSRSAQRAVQEEDLLRLREPIRDYLARSTSDEHELDDLTQETLVRVWEARRRVESDVAASYAVATARNLLLSRQRADAVHARHRHRLLDVSTDPLPDEAALREEERQAAAEAVTALGEQDGGLLTRQYAGAAPVPGAAGSSSRLARARARGRVNYLLALRRITLPTTRCRTVLDALSLGDRREQQRVGAARHLLSCQTCADCAEALVGRRRALFGLVPAPLLLLAEPLRRAWARAPRTTATATTATVLAAAAVLVIGQQLVTQQSPTVADARPPVTSAALPSALPTAAGASRPAPPAGEPGQLRVAGAAVTGAAWGGGTPASWPAGSAVVATRLPVQSVPADEGFWVGTQTQRFWVRLATTGESPQHVVAGDLVSFEGVVRAVDAAATAGLLDPEGRQTLSSQGVYVSVTVSQLDLG